MGVFHTRCKDLGGGRISTHTPYYHLATVIFQSHSQLRRRVRYVCTETLINCTKKDIKHYRIYRCTSEMFVIRERSYRSQCTDICRRDQRVFFKNKKKSTSSAPQRFGWMVGDLSMYHRNEKTLICKMNWAKRRLEDWFCLYFTISIKRLVTLKVSYGASKTFVSKYIFFIEKISTIYGQPWLSRQSVYRPFVEYSRHALYTNPFEGNHGRVK